jgi:hypothetical protein
VFALLVGEDWNVILYHYIRGSKSDRHAYAYFYIIFVVIFGNFILLQLFLAIRISKFSECTEKAILEQEELKRSENRQCKKEGCDDQYQPLIPSPGSDIPILY